MPTSPESVLSNASVRRALREAWQDSNPGTEEGHEEGGFIVQNAAGNLSVFRWPKGSQSAILVPPHRGCRIDEQSIVASFHTHPGTSSEFLQEPSETDRRAVRDDPDLKGAAYIGEFVVSLAAIYLITPAGHRQEIGDTQALFSE
jgi:hypothetical protein